MPSPSPDVKTALGDATGRVLAVSQVHRRLYTSDDVQQVAIDQYLTALVEDLRRSTTEKNSLSQLTIVADSVSVNPDRAVAIGVIVNELVTQCGQIRLPERPRARSACSCASKARTRRRSSWKTTASVTATK